MPLGILQDAILGVLCATLEPPPGRPMSGSRLGEEEMHGMLYGNAVVCATVLTWDAEIHLMQYSQFYSPPLTPATLCFFLVDEIQCV